MLRIKNRNEVVWARGRGGIKDGQRPAPKNERQEKILKHIYGQPPRNRFILEID